eukprot:467726-Pyramimonas_sp.AAC.1
MALVSANSQEPARWQVRLPRVATEEQRPRLREIGTIDMGVKRMGTKTDSCSFGGLEVDTNTHRVGVPRPRKMIPNS